jgi:hypothetical protein
MAASFPRAIAQKSPHFLGAFPYPEIPLTLVPRPSGNLGTLEPGHWLRKLEPGTTYRREPLFLCEGSPASPPRLPDRAPSQTSRMEVRSSAPGPAITRAGGAFANSPAG